MIFSQFLLRLCCNSIMEKWAGKLAVVTGASSGIGKAIVTSFAQAGINVVGLARGSHKIEEFAIELGDTAGKIHARQCDISNLNSVIEAFKWIEETFGSINILVNNAGVAYSVKILDESDDVTEKLVKTIDTNFTGLVHCTRRALTLLKKSDDYGMIINICDICGHSLPYLEEESMNVYAPTKYALTAFTEVLRREFVTQKNLKIRVSSVNPGTVDTGPPEAGDFFADTEDYLENTPQLQPSDISNGVLFLLETPFHVNITQLTIRPVGEKL